MHTFGRSLVVILAALLLISARAAVSEEVVGSGRLEMAVEGERLESGAASLERQWSARVSRSAENRLTGRVQLAGEVGEGIVEGQVAGSFVFGTVRDESGREVGYFEGHITPEGVEGKFTALGGETGSWSWDGPVPK
jgi:hypothetical protein